MNESILGNFRSAACWLTIAMALWSLTYYYTYGTTEGSDWIIQDLSVTLLSEFDISYENGSRLIMLISPAIIVSTICQLIITNLPLKKRLQARANQLFALFRGFEPNSDGIRKKNQYGLGDFNFNYLAFFLVTLPVLSFFFMTLSTVVGGSDLTVYFTGDDKWKSISNASAMAGTLALSFFLIPVTRHSVLLVAMGWSPLQALRIHVWAGYTSFLFILLHGIIYFGLWVRNKDESLKEQVFPGSGCWKLGSADRAPKYCRSQWYNFSGVMAFSFMLVLVLTSLNWVRRRYYKIFYIFHTTCAVGMLAGAAMHWRPIITFIAPSVIYYLGSTTPALIQAIASRFRGGVKVLKVEHLADAGGCKEIHLATSADANEALEVAPSMYIKMCVPSVSLVWHPFTVFKHPKDPFTARILMRPVGNFTKTLAQRWEDGLPTPVLIDGYFHAGNRCEEALQHDHVVLLCGGVAITPFLSLIPSILRAISKTIKSGRPVPIHKMVLHWSCRESGLSDYVCHNYLKGSKLAADAIGFDFEIIIHHTGHKTRSATLDPIKFSRHQGHVFLGTHDHQDSCLLASTTDVEDIAASEDIEDLDEDVAMPNEDPLGRDDFFEVPSNDELSKCFSEENTISASPSHPLEVHRFMPGRYKGIGKNVAAFLGIGGTLWLLFYIIFYYYRRYEVQVHEPYDRIWSLTVCFLTCLGLGIAFEVFSLIMRQIHQQQSGRPKPENRPEYMTVDDENESAVVIDHRRGRANIREIFDDAEDSTCPGIFMCGPPAITNQVREKAHRENSIFGQTRFVIYEDPFEM